MDDAGRVNPYEHLAFPGTGLLRLVVGERLGTIAGAQTNRLHAPLPNKHLSAERPKLSGGGHETRRLQPRRPAAVRCSAWLGLVVITLCASLSEARGKATANHQRSYPQAVSPAAQCTCSNANRLHPRT